MLVITVWYCVAWFLQVVGALQHERVCYVYKAAKWKLLNKSLSEADWSFIKRAQDPSIAASMFTRRVLDLAKEMIPYRKMGFSKSSHPWLNDHCRHLVCQKRRAYGHPDYAEKQAECSRGLRQAYYDYIERTKVKILELPYSSNKKVDAH